MTPGVIEQVRALYEERPYPKVPLLASLFSRVRKEQLPLLNYHTLAGHAFGANAPLVKRPKILVVGCGTFEPVAVALANPKAEIWAMDLSARAIRKARWQARLRGLKVNFFVGDLLDLPDTLPRFDYVVATGVLHHLPDPEAGLKALTEVASEAAIFRIMYYSKKGRELLYSAKDLLALAGARTPKAVRALMAGLPDGHPYKDYFFLYSDSDNDNGIADGYLHPCDNPLEALQLEALLARAGLGSRFFLHGPEGQPRNPIFAQFPQTLSEWERVALLDLVGELQENFLFVAARPLIAYSTPPVWRWSPVLPSRGKFFAKTVGKELSFRKTVDPSRLKAEEQEELRNAFFLY